MRRPWVAAGVVAVLVAAAVAVLKVVHLGLPC